MTAGPMWMRRKQCEQEKSLGNRLKICLKGSCACSSLVLQNLTCIASSQTINITYDSSDDEREIRNDGSIKSVSETTGKLEFYI